MKQALKHIIVALLGWQVRRLCARHAVKIVAVTGSIGKTSTKFAIATVLGQGMRVRFQEGNYNDIVTVPLVFFGEPLPSLLNPLAWVRLMWRNERQIYGTYPYDAVVLELGTDGPGQIAAFARFLHVDVAVVTAIAPEHMAFFGTLDAVAVEELAVRAFSERTLVNADLCAARYIEPADTVQTYALHEAANYHVTDIVRSADGLAFGVQKDGKEWVQASYGGIAEVQLYSLAAAAAVADMMGMETAHITPSLALVPVVSGRLQLLDGVNGSTIIDDTYNASPGAAIAALDTLYAVAAPTKIALLGNMNELGDYSPRAHTQVGEHTDPRQLSLVVTLGVDANTYLADAAQANGCIVVRVKTPYDAADAIRPYLRPGTVLLAKGSQNGVFAEEAVKLLLADPADARKLVRQSPAWLKKKAASFSRQA